MSNFRFQIMKYMWKKKYQKKWKFEKVVFLAKKFFFNYFSTLISNIFRKKIFFPRFEFSSSDVFKAFFEKMLFSIFFSILRPEPSSLARIHYFWCFSRKNDKTRKKISFWHFLGKFDFWSIFVILKISWVIGKPRFFFTVFLS